MTAQPTCTCHRAGSRHQVIGLDLIRFFAALSVVSFHLGYYAWASQAGTTQNAFGHVAKFELLEPYTWFGWVGVEIFFVISGFVIAYSAHRSSPYDFVVSRATRLLPAAWICCAITLAVVLMGDLLNPREALVEFLRTAILFPFGPWLDGAYWTLGIELSFYAVVFVLLVIGWFSGIEWVLGVLGGVSLVFWLTASAPSLQWLAPLADRRSVQILLVPHACFFAIGVMLWASMQRGLTFTRTIMMGVMLAGAMLEISHASRGFVAYQSPLIPLGVFLLGLAGIVLSIVFNDSMVRLAGRSAGAIRTVGLATYPLYLIHNVVGAFTERKLIVWGVGMYLAMAIAMALMVVAALAIAIVLEPPLKRQLRTVLLSAGRQLKLA